jgi:hypothetical protein
MSRRAYAVLLVLAVPIIVGATACGGGRERRRDTASGAAPPSGSPAQIPTATATLLPSRPTNTVAVLPPTVVPKAATQTQRAPTAVPAPLTPAPPRHRAITFNDYVPEQKNYVDVICVVVNFAGKPERVFDLRKYWDRIFGLQNPIRQLNAYYNETFYGQLELRPFSTPQMGEKGYIEVTLPGVPQDWTFGWLIGLEDERIDSLNPDAVQRVVLEVMTRVVEKHPEINYQDKYFIVVLNAPGSEYGRGAAGVLPGDGADSPWDMFIGNVVSADRDKFSDENYFRVLDDSRLIGFVGPKGYTFERYFQDREKESAKDQFVLGIALFGSDGPLSCASHDILHGLRRKSAYADPPEGRTRAVHCLYNLVQQSKWVVGTQEHGTFDRSITVSPYIGWWDPMSDHLHPKTRDFFESYPHGMCAFTKLRMGFIPDRCLAVAESDDVTVKLSPLGITTLPPRGSPAEALAIKVPLVPLNPSVSHVYLLLEYRRRVGSESGEVHPDNFTLDPEFVFGDIRFDPGYNAANPAASNYVNPPMVFVPDEGVLAYLVNDKVPEVPGAPYTEWYNFNLALLNPAGNDKRDNLNDAALDAGESMSVDFSTLIPGRAVPVKIAISVTERKNEYATVHVVREYLR